MGLSVAVPAAIAVICPIVAALAGCGAAQRVHPRVGREHDNESQFAGRLLNQWAYLNEVKMEFS